ncbi:serine/threonine-protein kinase Pak-like [Tachypleus tridentatus]|uniref:serine/threonine-protein kinase Pak-like n=1 Tax=Tachypleus tridentatus TaxID=6853 RepID=UPI003FD0631D
MGYTLSSYYVIHKGFGDHFCFLMSVSGNVYKTIETGNALKVAIKQMNLTKQPEEELIIEISGLWKNKH